MDTTLQACTLTTWSKLQRNAGIYLTQKKPLMNFQGTSRTLL